MDMNEIGQEYNKLPQETREIIVKFIEHKTDLDMQQVITKINDFSNKINDFSNKISDFSNRMDRDIQSLEKSTNAQIQSLEKSYNNLKWFIGIFGSVMTILLAILAFKH